MVDAQRATNPTGDFVHGLTRVPGGLQCRACLRQQLLPGVGEPDLPGGAQQEWRFQLPFQRRDRRRHRGLDDVQPGCGAGEAGFLHDGDEALQLAQLHAPIVAEGIAVARVEAEDGLVRVKQPG